MSSKRDRIRKIVGQYLERNDPLGWFEAVYKSANQDAAMISWADMAPHPKLIEYLEHPNLCGEGKKALVVGCGLGDDAEELSRQGFKVLAFDISESAIRWCHTRFPDSTVEYLTMDLFQTPESWEEHFDFVFEAYTLQVLPPDLRKRAIGGIARFITPGGRLVIICRGRDAEDDTGTMPWPLTKNEIEQFSQYGLTEIRFDDYMDQEEPPARRFNIEFLKSDYSKLK